MWNLAPVRRGAGARARDRQGRRAITAFGAEWLQLDERTRVSTPLPTVSRQQTEAGLKLDAVQAGEGRALELLCGSPKS